MQRKILFLGETYRADAITWMEGLKEFGQFEIITWEMRHTGQGLRKIWRALEYLWAPVAVRKLIKAEKPDMVIAERTTSFGYLAAITGHHPIAVAQQGKTDIWPEHSVFTPVKKAMQRKTFKKADLLHAWGPIMGDYMRSCGVPERKIMQMPKGIDLRKFNTAGVPKPNDKIRAIVTRSLRPEYCHSVILQAFAQLKKQQIPFELILVGDGPLAGQLKAEAQELGIEDSVIFTGRIPYHALPAWLQKANTYVSMPVTEGVSASLFEAMATGNLPFVTDISGNQAWIKHGYNGWLIPAGDATSLASTMIAAWKNRQAWQDAVLYNLQWVQQHANYEQNMRLIAERYHQLIDLKARRNRQ